MRFFEEILSDLRKGENVDAYSALLLGVFCSIIGAFSVSNQYVFIAISIVLTLLVLGNLIDRRTNKELNETLKKIIYSNRAVYAKRDASQFLQNITGSISGASREICLLVRSGGTLKTLYPDLLSAIDRGCEVRIILCSRDDVTLSLMAFRGHRTKRKEDISAELELSVRLLCNLAFNCNPSRRDLLKVREIPYVPPVGISITDLGQPTGRMFVVPVSFRSSSRSGPSLMLSRKEDYEIFSYFEQEFENYWNASKNITDVQETKARGT